MEISNMLYVRTSIIPVEFGDLGLIKNGHDRSIKRIPDSTWLKGTQNIILPSRAHILRRAISI